MEHLESEAGLWSVAVILQEQTNQANKNMLTTSVLYYYNRACNKSTKTNLDFLDISSAFILTN